ncbi:hypothetical protein GCM10027598_74780 [Amycolatopsis oliviviridis]|uniref:Uncharacterized protein n=1 Tax=Amycolatopsis oliviviridis TaxID=1471590 RepID=A0ABQ3L466_9PSEU|nr:hypothetical protein [Amycolatopsis oliviviridis]GHH03107.1 hypothetical protein GCM10017790_04720 [Amycolatopsis oliviviridis]
MSPILSRRRDFISSRKLDRGAGAADGRFVVRRATANHWRLRREENGWAVTVRTNRVLDGRPESPALLRQAGD